MESTKFKLLINSITKEMNVYNVCDFYNNHYNIVNFINKNIPSLKVIHSDATYLVWIDISSISNDSVSFCKNLRESTGLYVSEGEEYGTNGKKFIRMNIATSRKNVLDGLNRLKYFVNKKDL